MSMFERVLQNSSSITDVSDLHWKGSSVLVLTYLSHLNNRTVMIPLHVRSTQVRNLVLQTVAFVSLSKFYSLLKRLKKLQQSVMDFPTVICEWLTSGESIDSHLKWCLFSSTFNFQHVHALFPLSGVVWKSQSMVCNHLLLQLWLCCRFILDWVIKCSPTTQ